MQYLWFTLGTLAISDAQPAFWHDTALTVESTRAMLRQYVHWLPEILELRHDLGVGYPTMVIPQEESVVPDYLSSIVIAANRCGYRISMAHVMECLGHAGMGNVAEFLIEKRVIAPKNQRFVLME